VSRAASLPLLLLALPLSAAAQDRAAAPAPAAAALTPAEVIAIPVPSDPRVSPDGRLVAFTLTTTDPGTLAEQRRVWLLDLGSNESWQATAGQGEDWAPRWAPQGATLAFLSSRSGSPQVWTLPTRGGEPRRLTGVDLPLRDFEWSGNGRTIFAVADVPAPDSGVPPSARPRRDIGGWRTGVARHLFAIPVPDGAATDVTPAGRDVPRLGASSPGFTVTSLGTEVAWASPGAAGDLDIVTMAPDGSGVQALARGGGDETRPAYSPDSRFIAFLQSERVGHPSARRALVLYERAAGRRFSLSADWPRSVEAFTWATDSRSVVVEVAEAGARTLHRLEVASGRRTALVTNGTNTDAAPASGRTVFIHSTAGSPPELWSVRDDGSGLERLTRFGAPLERRFLPRAESFWVRSGADSVQVLLVRPAGPAPAARLPLLVLLHGGLGRAWSDGWEAQWNAALFAARGWLVAMPNLRGSAGYGEPFVAAAWRRPGGPAGEDLGAVLQALGARADVDATRIAIAGEAQGAALALWYVGQGKQLAGLVAHAPIVDPVSHAGTTSAGNLAELYGGTAADPAARAAMERWSPLNFAATWGTPVLFTHGTEDDEVDVSQSLEGLALLEARGLERGIELFRGEGHRLERAESRVRWWITVTRWLDLRFTAGAQARGEAR
jgi:dipeptidyl aminopeptidase/acylaminoacyl peptidase